MRERELIDEEAGRGWLGRRACARPRALRRGGDPPRDARAGGHAPAVERPQRRRSARGGGAPVAARRSRRRTCGRRVGRGASSRSAATTSARRRCRRRWCRSGPAPGDDEQRAGAGTVDDPPDELGVARPQIACGRMAVTAAPAVRPRRDELGLRLRLRVPGAVAPDGDRCPPPRRRWAPTRSPTDGEDTTTSRGTPAVRHAATTDSVPPTLTSRNRRGCRRRRPGRRRGDASQPAAAQHGARIADVGEHLRAVEHGYGAAAAPRPRARGRRMPRPSSGPSRPGATRDENAHQIRLGAEPPARTRRPSGRAARGRSSSCGGGRRAARTRAARRRPTAGATPPTARRPAGREAGFASVLDDDHDLLAALGPTPVDGAAQAGRGGDAISSGTGVTGRPRSDDMRRRPSTHSRPAASR